MSNEGGPPTRHYHTIDTDLLAASSSSQVELRSRSRSPADLPEVFSEDQTRNDETLTASTEASKTLPMQTRALRLSSGVPADEVSDYRLPPVNCKEKIIFCLDISSEMTTTYFTSKTGDKEQQSSLVRKALRMFLSLKASMSSKHEYALMLLSDKAFWMCDFDTDVANITTKFDAASQLSQHDSCDLSTIFEEIRNHVQLYNKLDTSPMYTVRVILLYGRSHCIPQLTVSKAQQELQKSPHFFVDVLYLHEPVAEDNESEKIFEILCNLDVHGTSYILEASKNPTKVCDSMAQMIGHPLQRCLQHHLNYTLE